MEKESNLVDTQYEEATNINIKIKRYKLFVLAIFVILFVSLLLSNLFVGIGKYIFGIVSLCALIVFLKWG